MNILFLANHLNTGGITSYIFTLAKGLKRIGHHVSVATSGGNKVGELEALGFKHCAIDIRTKSELSPRIYFSLPRLNRFIRDENIDILHVHTRVTQVAAVFLSRNTRRPFVTTCHGFFKPRLFRKMFPCWGQGIVAISEPVREHLISDFGVDSKKIALIHNGIDLADFPLTDDATKLRMRREFGISQGPVIGIIARLSDVKGHSILISAMKKIIFRIPSALLLIIGEGKMEDALKGQVKDLGLRECIRFYPIVNKTAAMLSLMDVFVMPSLQEGLGLSVMEAQAMNLPVVGSRVGGIPSLIEEGKTGILVSPGNVDELEQGIIRLLSDLPKAKEMGSSARKFIEKNFSAEEMAAKTADFYQQIIGEYEALRAEPVPARRSAVLRHADAVPLHDPSPPKCSTLRVGLWLRRVHPSSLLPQAESGVAGDPFSSSSPGIARGLRRRRMKKILVVNVNWVGDVIFSTPVFKALKATYPQAAISCLAVPRVRDILESAPCLDEIIIYDERGRHQTPWAKIKLVLELRKRKFDVVFLLHRSLTRALLVFLAGIPVRVGYDTKKRGFLLTHRSQPLSGAVHRSDYYLGVIESFGVAVKDRRCELKVDDQARHSVEQLLGQNGITKEDFVVVLNAGGNWDLKRWPKENFAKLADLLIENFKAKVIISGAPKDVPLAQEITSMMHDKPVVLAGRTNLKELAALLEKANLVISNDSGPLHVANCVGTPVIGLFGPTRPEITGPRGKGRFSVIQNDVSCNKEPCYDLGCSDNVCMKSITVEQVVDEIRRFKN